MTKKIRPTNGEPGDSQAVAQWWIQHNIHAFECSRNPVFIWEAIAEALCAGLEFPREAREYLRDAAVEIGRLSRDKRPKKNGIGRAVARALRFESRGPLNPFSQLGRPGDEISIAFDVYECQTMHRRSPYVWGMDAVFKDVADRRSLSISTVKRFWYKHALKVIPPHLVKQSQSQKLDDILR